jgi:hypothetical protein
MIRFMPRFRQNAGTFRIPVHRFQVNFFGWFTRLRLLSNRGFFLAAWGLLALEGQALAQSSVTLAWNAVTNSPVAGYRVYRGGASRAYTNNVNAGASTETTLTGLITGATYFFAVTAYTGAGLESDYSTEINYTVPATNTASPPVITLTSPANGDVYAEPASLNLAASVTTNGHSITKVQFFGGSTLLAEDLTSPFSFTWTNVLAGTYNLTARLVYDAGSTVDSAVSAVSVASSRPPPVTLPPPWLTTDIGNPGATGTANYNSGVYTVAGAGNLSDPTDNFSFVYQALTGDGEIRAQLNSIQNTGSNACVGVMMRETLAANSRDAFIGVSPAGLVRAQWRSSTAATTTAASSSFGSLMVPNAWVRLKRSANKFTFYTSADGVNWNQVASPNNLRMATSGYFGLALASGNSAILNTSSFSNVTVVP